jgi:nitrogenase molybdenum-iron protein alpha/beta subunit
VSSHTRPDALTGAVAAFEGVRGVVSCLNAPTGPKFAPGYLVDRQDPRDHGVDPAEYAEPFFFGQPRVPATALDELDYVGGSAPKLTALLRRLDARGPAAIGIVNGAGTALIGDDLLAIARDAGVRAPVAAVEGAGLLGQAGAGSRAALRELLALAPAPDPAAPRAQLALTGSTLLALRWADDLRALREELALAGVTDVVVAGAGGDLAELGRAPGARAHAVLHESHALELDGPAAVDAALAPIGLPAAGGDPAGLDARAAEVRTTVARAVSRIATRTGLPAGVPFAVAADAAVVAPLVLHLADHLGMHPAGVVLRERAPRAEAFLAAFADARGLDLPVLADTDPATEADALAAWGPELVLGSTHDLETATAALGTAPGFVAVQVPEAGRLLLTPRPLLGLAGVLTLTEDVLHALVGLSRSALL